MANLVDSGVHGVLPCVNLVHIQRFQERCGMGIRSAQGQFDPPFRFESKRRMIGWYWIGAGIVSLALWGGVVAVVAYLA
jgi:hypothetical protein